MAPWVSQVLADTAVVPGVVSVISHHQIHRSHAGMSHNKHEMRGVKLVRKNTYESSWIIISQLGKNRNVEEFSKNVSGIIMIGNIKHG